MLAELAHTALTLVGAPLAAWPHVSEAVGLWSRGKRQAAAWPPHLQRTQSAILAAMPVTRGRVVVLGSGPLFDVPLAQLCAAYDEVMLVDRVHLMSARRQGRANVQFLWRDLSAGLDDVPEADWTISVNLVSQLARGAPEGTERKVVDRHLGQLGALDGAATLVSDLGYRVLDRAGRERERFDLLYGRPMPPPAARWDWEVAPFGEEAADTRRIHEVGVWPDWTAVADHAP